VTAKNDPPESTRIGTFPFLRLYTAAETSLALHCPSAPSPLTSFQHYCVQSHHNRYHQPRPCIRLLWTGADGLCTSWSVAVAHRDPHRQYVYGDMGRHRAYFARDGMVIDSSARIPIVVGGKLRTVKSKTWTMQDGRLYFGVLCASHHNLWLVHFLIHVYY
jgi:hypothetical protein